MSMDHMRAIWPRPTRELPHGAARSLIIPRQTTDAPNNAIAGDLAAAAVRRSPIDVRRYGTARTITSYIGGHVCGSAAGRRAYCRRA
jgi:hypothetical protein